MTPVEGLRRSVETPLALLARLSTSMRMRAALPLLFLAATPGMEPRMMRGAEDDETSVVRESRTAFRERIDVMQL
jgi:hypothetical protein